jgi:hypothetical protein
LLALRLVKTRTALTAIVGSLVLAGLACSGAPLGGRGTGGSGGDGAPCTVFTGCGTGFGGDIAAGGTAGSDAGNGTLCNQLTDAYSAAVTAALACTPGAPNQCKAQVAIAPTACPGSVCGSQERVNDGTEVESLRQKWLSACEPGVRIECIDIGCAPPLPPSICVATNGSGATSGTCVPSGVSDGGSTDAAFDGGESCDQLAADYTAAVTAAQACTPGAPNQCRSTVSATVSACPPNGCGPEAYVNDAAGVNAVRARWLSQCGGGVACPKIVCLPLAVAVACVPVDGGTDTTTGVCVSGVQPTN